MKLTLDLTVVIDFLSQILGNNTEIALHDLNDIDSSLIDIRNGHITNRQIGMPLTDFALEMVKKFSTKKEEKYKVNYLSLAKNGKKLRSSSLLLCDEQNKPVAMLCLNHDDSNLNNLIDELKKITAFNNDSDVKENFSGTVKDLCEGIIYDVISESSIPISRLSVDEKICLVKQLSQKGVFLMKGSVEIVSDILNISEPTLYRYLKQIDM